MKINLKLLIFLLWTIITLFQSIIFLNETSLASAFMVILGGYIAFIFILRQRLLVYFPVSTMMITGFATYYFFLPPIATLIEGKPLTNNIDYPLIVLLNSVLCLVVLIAAHHAYRVSRATTISHAIAERLYRPLGYFNAPSNAQLLLMGMIGLLAILQQVFMSGVYEEIGVWDKLIQGIYPLAYLPYLILVGFIFDDKNRTKARLNMKWVVILALYTAILLFLSVGKNSRAAFLVGITSVALIYLYGAITGLNNRKLFKIKFLLPLTLLFGALLGPLSDLATSMVIVRSHRAETSAMELAGETMRVFMDKERLRAFRGESHSSSIWDETYVDNLFLSRLCNLKYTDNGLDLAESLDSGRRSFLRELELQKAFAILPQPILNALGMNIDKEIVSQASGGDLLLYAATGNHYVLGGFRTGSMLGSGYALFGWWYLPVFFVLFFITFILADAQTIIAKYNNYNKIYFRPILSPMFAITSFYWFFYFTSAATGIESTAGLLNYIIRGWIQTLILYTILYRFTNFFIKK